MILLDFLAGNFVDIKKLSVTIVLRQISLVSVGLTTISVHLERVRSTGWGAQYLHLHPR